MKTLLIVLSLLTANTLFSDELKWVNEQIEAIKPARTGVSDSKVNATTDPFLFLEKKKVSVSGKTLTSTSKSSSYSRTKKSYKRALSLDAIINESAMINGKWYELNDKVGNYTLSSVNKRNVVLQYKSSKILLSTDSKNDKLKFNNK
jgi:hypothetical protein